MSEKPKPTDTSAPIAEAHPCDRCKSLTKDKVCCDKCREKQLASLAEKVVSDALFAAVQELVSETK